MRKLVFVFAMMLGVASFAQTKEELKSQLKPYSGEISENIEKYVDSVLSLSESDFSKIIKSGKDIISESETLESFYDDINQTIKKIDKH